MNDPFFEIKEEETKVDYSKFVISPLAQGFGTTLGNSLRRVLLSSMAGAVVTSVRISGVKHQFSTLKGMKEDVVEFVLNLKKVRFQYEGDKPAKAKISVSGPGEVKAKDIQCDSSVKIANPDLVLAVLNKDAKLEADLIIEKGVGYSPAEERKTGEIGLIPMDASFSPVNRVDYRVEETRVGRLTDYDKLIIEVWTDGTVSPKDAVVSASKILIDYFNQIVLPKKVEKKEEKKESGLGPIGNLSVEEVGLPTRVANALIKAGYDTIEDLVNAKRADLVKVRNLGEKSVKIVEVALGERDLEILN
ncbi:DNA-directed RNA polymerase subunit alpha [Candidatus Woesebacteria bacterium]|nr:MAG: DNA-directed RNA polymerase subunit alpha [Candidatus Woesebacteria bacterium]